MEYGKIIAITGMPGLYEMMNSKGDGAIVKSLDDQSTKFVSGRVHQFTHLESIEVYTQRENVNLVEVLNAIKDSGEKLPDEKDGKALTAFFQKVYPNLDFDRVYTSDMKKMVKWFNVLVKNEVDIKLTEAPEETEEEEIAEPSAEEASAASEAVAEKPAKKAKGKKAEPAEEETEEEEPAKKPKAKAEARPEAKSKKAAPKEEAAPKKAAARKKKEE